jgi:DinB superfamily
MSGRGSAAASISRVSAQLSEMIAICERGEAETCASRISAWPVVRHFDHLTRAGRPVLKRLAEEPDGPDAPEGPARRRVNLLGRFVLGFGWMPRGLGRAPAGTKPDLVPDPRTVLERLRQMHAFARAIAARPTSLENSRITARHPVLGDLTAAQWARFLAVHQHHHMKIVRDILAAPRAS